jgi:sugar O-acyltransferase (sialic acid O-acetyltransferase NeuD family)
MKKVVVFGTTQTAELANYYLSQTSDEYEIVAFTVDKQYRQTDLLFGKPLVDFDKVEQIYPPTDYYLFAPMTGKGLNKLRERVFLEGKQKGYKFITYISKYATVLSKDIGENCFILEDNTIQPFVTIGNNCVLWSGNHIGHHSIIKDHVFITSHVVISGNCIINNYCWIGVNATIRNGLNIAEGSLVSMGACLTKDTEPYTVYMGVPAKFKGSSLVEAVSSSL